MAKKNEKYVCTKSPKSAVRGCKQKYLKKKSQGYPQQKIFLSKGQKTTVAVAYSEWIKNCSEHYKQKLLYTTYKKILPFAKI